MSTQTETGIDTRLFIGGAFVEAEGDRTFENRDPWSGDVVSEVANGSGVSVQTFSREGDPADAILDVAEERDADLIVVGNKGMTGAKRFLLGSVPNKVSHHAPCSVLIIRTT